VEQLGESKVHEITVALFQTVPLSCSSLDHRNMANPPDKSENTYRYRFLHAKVSSFTIAEQVSLCPCQAGTFFILTVHLFPTHDLRYAAFYAWRCRTRRKISCFVRLVTFKKTYPYKSYVTGISTRNKFDHRNKAAYATKLLNTNNTLT